MNIFESMPNASKINRDTLSIEESELVTRRGATTDKGMQAIAERIIELRKAAGFTQTQLADELGVTQPVISGIERGELRVHGEFIVQLARILHASADDILGIRVTKRHTDKMTPELKRLWKKFQQIADWPEKDQRAVIRLINTVTKSTV